MNKLTHIKLNNFTAFSKLELTFSPGVNLFIGANGTGKTHLLKVLYAACAITVGEDVEKGYRQKLVNVFNPHEGRMGRLARRKSGSVNAEIEITRQGGTRLKLSFSNHTANVDDAKLISKQWRSEPLNSAYIPVKEMLAHAPGFLATTARREIAFEEVYSDIIKHAFLPRLRGPTEQNRQRLLKALQTSIKGTVIAKGEYFFLKSRQGDLEFTLLAEGMRKLALIWLLIQNGTLLAGTVLFWDEPEANLNPSLMGEVVKVILELQRMGVQVFLTTHNYVLLKEFDLQKQANDEVSYFSLFRDDSQAVVAKVSPNYLAIDPNLITETFNGLYDRELQRSLGS